MNEPKKQIIAAIVTILAVLLLTIVASAQSRVQHKPGIPDEMQAAKDAQLKRTLALANDGARFARDRMNDPESFRVSLAWVTDEGAVCMEFRAKNGLGGYVQSRGVYTAGDFYTYHGYGIQVWGKECLKDNKVSENARKEAEERSKIPGNYDWLTTEQIQSIMDTRPGLNVTEKVKAALKADRDKE